VFVGRERELAALDAHLEQALSGRGGIIMLAGEPGIGKTRIAEMFARTAARRGMLVAWGRCCEELGAPPYWPWVQAIRAWLDMVDDDRLIAAVAENAFLLSELAVELRARLPTVAPMAAVSNPDEARFRLFDAVSGLWKRVAEQCPLMLVLDDLHWADTPSLKLLEFFSHEVDARPILILGTYRDIEVSRRHPLSDTLGELARRSGFRRVQLKGLSLVEASQFVAVATGRPQPGEMVEMLHARTEGNPLFLAEMTRFFQQEGLIGARANHVRGGSGNQLRHIPDGVREVIGRRLNGLSPTCGRLLSAAAVVGRVFSLDVLERVSEDVSDEQRGAVLEEALRAHVIEAMRDPGQYQFTHGLLREILYDEMPAPKRTRLHGRIGSVLEDLHRDELTRWLSTLAYHYGAALPKGDSGKAVDYARRAGERADALLAYEEAARHFQLALKALEARPAPNHAQRCKLLISLGEAQTAAGENLEALTTFREAAAIANALGVVDDLVRAALGFEGASWRPGFPGEAAAGLLDEALAALGDEDSIDRARVLSALARALGFSTDSERAEQVGEQAVSMARRLGDEATLSLALNLKLWAWQPWRPDLAKRAELAREAYRIAQQVGDKVRMLEAATTYQLYGITVGDFRTWYAVLDASESLAEEVRQPFYRLWWRAARAAQALFEGNFEKSERLTGQGLELASRQHGLDYGGVYSFQMFNIERERGGLKALAPLVSQFVQSTPKTSTWRPALALVLAELGMKEEARAEFEALAAGDFAAIPRDSMWSACMVYLSEVCAVLGDAQRAATLYRMLSPFDGHTVVAGACVGCYGAMSRFLGLLATTMKRWSDAERHFQDALEMNARMGARVWVAHTQHDYATMFVARGQPGDGKQALALLEAALATSRELGMRGLEERGAALMREVASPATPPAYPAGLSRREVDVLRLVAAGKSNHDIAERLFLSEHTVANHVRNILAKTETSNRTEAAAFAIRHGLPNT